MPGRAVRGAGVVSVSVGMQVEPAAPHQVGAGQRIALQQLEDAAKQFAAMKRRGKTPMAGQCIAKATETVSRQPSG